MQHHELPDRVTGPRRVLFAVWIAGFALVATACVDDPAGPGGGGIAPPPTALSSSVPLAARPFGVAVGPDGTAYVTHLDAAMLTRFDLALAAATGTVTVGAVPTAVTFSPDGGRAYVTNQASRTMGIVDVATDVMTAEVPVAGDPFRVATSPDGSNVFVTLNNGRVTTVSASGQIQGSIDFQTPINGIAVRGSSAWVSAPTSGMVARFSVGGTVDLTFQIGGAPQEIVVSRGGETVFVADESRGLVALDVASGNTRVVALSGGGFGMAVHPGWEKLFITVPSRGVVEVVDIASLTLESTIPVGGVPRRIAFDASGRTALVADETGAARFLR